MRRPSEGPRHARRRRVACEGENPARLSRRRGSRPSRPRGHVKDLPAKDGSVDPARDQRHREPANALRRILSPGVSPLFSLSLRKHRRSHRADDLEKGLVLFGREHPEEGDQDDLRVVTQRRCACTQLRNLTPECRRETRSVSAGVKTGQPVCASLTLRSVDASTKPWSTSTRRFFADGHAVPRSHFPTVVRSTPSSYARLSCV